MIMFTQFGILIGFHLPLLNFSLPCLTLCFLPEKFKELDEVGHIWPDCVCFLGLSHYLEKEFICSLPWST